LERVAIRQQHDMLDHKEVKQKPKNSKEAAANRGLQGTSCGTVPLLLLPKNEEETSPVQKKEIIRKVRRGTVYNWPQEAKSFEQNNR